MFSDFLSQFPVTRKTMAQPPKCPMQMLGKALSHDDEKRREKVTALVKTISAEEREILDKSFKYMEEDPGKSGLGVFIRLFQDYPEYKCLWPKFKFIPDSSLMNSEELTKFAHIYIAGLRSIVEHLDDNESLADLFHKIALIHQTKGVKRYHLEKMLPTLMSTLKDAMNKPLDKQTEAAWTKMFDIIASMIEIYTQHERKK